MEKNKEFRYNGLTPNDGSLAFIYGTVIMLILSFILGLFRLPSNTLNLTYSFVSQVLFMFVSFFIALFSFKRDCKGEKKLLVNTFYSLGFTKRTNVKLLGVSLLLPIFSILAFLPLSVLIEYLFSLIGYSPELSYPDYTSSPQMLVLCIFALAIFPAFGEEMLMRGALMHGLRAKGTTFAITLSALMFALLHGSPVQFVHQFMIGLIMAFIVCMTDCLWHSIIFHFMNNFIVLIYEYAYVNSGATYVIPSWGYVIMCIVGLVGLVGSLILFVKVAGGNNFKEERGKLVAENAKVKGTYKAIINISEYKYKEFDKTKYVSVYVALVIIVVIWVLNTLAGWIL